MFRLCEGRQKGGPKSRTHGDTGELKTLSFIEEKQTEQRTH